MSNQDQMMFSSETKRPKTHGGMCGGIYNIMDDPNQICPRTGNRYTSIQHVHPEEKGDRIVMVEEFTCSQCGETIKKFERDPHILYS